MPNDGKSGSADSGSGSLIDAPVSACIANGDHGTMNITMVSTTVFDQSCQPYYFVLEASSGGCADIDFLVD